MLPGKLSIVPALFKAGSSLYYCHKLSVLSLYSIKLYIDSTTSMPLVLSICILFILLMQSVNGAQFLNTAPIPLFSLPAANYLTVIVPPTSIYALL